MIISENINFTNIKMWISGHTHWSYDFIDPNTEIRYISNQAGYKEEFIIGQTGFDDLKVFEI